MFDNEMTWLFIAIALCIIASFYFHSQVNVEREHTKQLEVQLKLAQISQVTNNVEQ